jgi:lipoprotein-anchoring transpeptidase ErfK/SrfK
MALASQTARAQSMPRSSESYGRGRRIRHKRLVGILLLAGLCVGLTYWAVRDRGGAGAPTSTAPGTTSLVATNPLGEPRASRAPEPSTPSPAAAPSLTMGEVREPLANSVVSKPLPPPNASMQANPPAPTTTPAPATNQPAVTPPAPSTTSAPLPSATNDIAAPAGSIPPAGSTAAADRALAQGRPLEARNILNRALVDPRTPEAERPALRKRLTELNQNLVFGPAQTPGDAFSETYRVVSGDNLTKINRKLGLLTEPTLIARINKLANPGAIKVGQTLKVLRGPFHAVVDKSEFRMDVYAGPAPTPSSVGTSGLPGGAEAGWTYICSFPVGLGSQGTTPIASFTVKQDSKLINPHWVNPRTGEKFDANDPKNPIGERWLGLDGLDDKSKAFTGYGIHGTIDAASVGQEMSMGCVRLNGTDVELVYELLTPRISVVKIVP